MDDENPDLITRRAVPHRHTDLPEWEVYDGDRLVGWIIEKHLGGKSSSSVFYNAVAVHPDTGARFDLENSTDFDERLRVIAAFRADPMTSVHYRDRLRLRG